MRTAIVLTLQAAAAAVVAAALLGANWLDPGDRPRTLVLVDRSTSVPAAAAERAWIAVERSLREVGEPAPMRADFGGRVGDRDAPETSLEVTSTNIAVALRHALAVHAESPLGRIVVVSDGHETLGDARQALLEVRTAGLPVQWVGVGRPPPPVRVIEVLAPTRGRAGEQLTVTVRVDADAQRPLQARIVARSPSGAASATVATVGTDGLGTVSFDASDPGPVVIDAIVEDATTGETLARRTDAALIDVEPPAATLVVRGSDAGALVDSLVAGGWPVEVVPARGLDARAEELAAYQAIVLDDVAVADAGPRFWNALEAAVRQRGVGLLVLGGERSFAGGGYRGSVLESLLPVRAEASALDDAAAVVFLVDKSGSMGEGAAGVDRFALARRAVLETARQLGEHDAAGLVVFDVEPRVLVPLAPAATAKPLLARDWGVGPRGGTRLAPALAAAADQLERARPARRLLVVVTDGFVEEPPLEALRERLASARIEVVALGVGPDADIAALRRFVGADVNGAVVAVGAAAELPRAMRTAVERRRQRVERGPVAVEAHGPLPLARSVAGPWPEVSAYQVTRPAPEAVVAVSSVRGDPLIAWRTVGAGRVVAVTSGLGAWTPDWLRWSAWPDLAGGLAGWIGADARSPTATLRVTDSGEDLEIEADLASDEIAASDHALSLHVAAPSAPARAVRAEWVAPRRLHARIGGVGPGLHTVVLTSAAGARRQFHLHRRPAEDDAWGVHPRVEAWLAQGLIVARLPPAAPVSRPDRIDLSLVALALVLVTTGIVADRARGCGPECRRRLRATVLRLRLWLSGTTERRAGA